MRMRNGTECGSSNYNKMSSDRRRHGEDDGGDLEGPGVLSSGGGFPWVVSLAFKFCLYYCSSTKYLGLSDRLRGGTTNQLTSTTYM